MTEDMRKRVEAKLFDFIVDELLDDLHGGGDPLVAEAVDSLALEQLVDYIEEEFGVQLNDEDLVTENFQSIPVLARLVDSRRRGARA